MSNRTERREAERAARKLAYQQMRQKQSQSSVVAAPESNLSEASPVSNAQLAANRANALHSTGPVTAEGRVRSSKNALKHGLTGKTVLLPHEDPARYQSELEDRVNFYTPATEEELRLVQSIHDCNWRLDRVQYLESAILLKGHLEFAEKFEDRTPTERTHLINAEAYLKYERQLRNLHIQEARLRRTMEKEKAELRQLQTVRKRDELSAPSSVKPNQAAAPNANGFEFSTPQLSDSTDAAAGPEPRTTSHPAAA